MAAHDDHSGDVGDSGTEDHGHKDKDATAAEEADTGKTGTGGDHLDPDGGNPGQKLHK